ncbi:MAG: M18 family aminopeptidase [Clostridia bacterium]|nr:M18 family aminopeptidase [Clostridia bacterium]
MSKNTAESLISFIKESPVSFHAVENITNRLSGEGYTALFESDAWDVVPGGKYYVTRGGSSVIAFRVPEKTPVGFMMCASHSDSPTFKIKEYPETESAGMYVRLHTERYGGMLCATWLDRPLSVAGRVVVRENGRIVPKLVSIDRDLVMIPNVAIHMMRNANDGMSYNANVDLFPLFGDTADRARFRAIIAEAAGVKEEDILGSDLFLYNRMEGTVWGASEQYLSAPRLDDLQCAFASLEAFVKAKDSVSIPVLAVLDNEEVGSQTKQGAASTFLFDVLSRITEALSLDYRRMIALSFLVSADNAHAVHPNHPEFADPTHRPRMNGGIVVKHNANQRYTTDAVSEAIFTEICKAADVPVQFFANRSDMVGGSTLGNISNTQVSLNTVDVGLAQLAMHSSYETAGVHDTDYMITALTKLYESSLKADGDGAYTLV